MRTFHLMQVDAFTQTVYGGNPCAVVFDAESLTDEEMLLVAREVNLSETSFIVPASRADLAARYFTPRTEIPLAGHPTLATVRAAIEVGLLKLGQGMTTVRLALKAGVVDVDVEIAEGAVGLITMEQPRPCFLREYPAAQVLPLFGLVEEDGLEGAPVQTVSTGTPQLMVPLKGLEPLRRAALQLDAYRAFMEQGDFFCAHLFCLEGATQHGDTFARDFDLPPGPIEDPFTGSATGGMAAYLWRYGLIDSPVFTAEQGHWLGRPGAGQVQVIGSREDIRAVRVAGHTVVVMKGELRI